MDQKVRAIYRSGAFVPQEPFAFPEGSEVELIIHGTLVLAPQVTDPAERARILQRLTERMRNNPIPEKATHLTREQLHERR